MAKISQHLSSADKQISVTDATVNDGAANERFAEDRKFLGLQNAAPRKCERILRPWLDIANGIAKPPLTFDNRTFGLSPAFFEPIQESIRRNFELMVDHAEILRVRDPDRLDRFRRTAVEDKVANLTAGSIQVLWSDPGGGQWGELALGLDGLLIDNPNNLHGLFVAALRGAQLARFRRCPVCRHYFYATRTDQKACSRKCGPLRRVIEWREGERKKAEQAVKLAGLGQDIKQIACALDVGQTDARKYLNQGRKLRRKGART